MRIEREYRGDKATLARDDHHAAQDFAVACVHSVEVADGQD
jgi:hypothetical protein